MLAVRFRTSSLTLTVLDNPVEHTLNWANVSHSSAVTPPLLPLRLLSTCPAAGCSAADFTPPLAQVMHTKRTYTITDYRGIPVCI